MGMFRTLTKNEIECRAKQVTEKGAVLLLYKTARTDMDLLDETVGAENWESDYKEIKGNLYCGLGIRCKDGVVWKWDCGIESREDGDGNEKKGEASDAFKRAGFKWGIGRELYTAPFIWVRAEDFNLKCAEYGGKRRFSTNDTFSVRKITYTNEGAIDGLLIVNDKTKKIVFTQMPKEMPKAQEAGSNA